MDNLGHFNKIEVYTKDDIKIAEVTPEDMWCDEHYSLVVRPTWYDKNKQTVD